MRRVRWVGSSLNDLRSLPDPVQDGIGYALYQAQLGGKATNAKPLRGFGGAGVIEIVQDFDGDAYRAVYTLILADAVYVLHVVHKKSTKGIATPQRDLDLIRHRLHLARAHHDRRPE